MPAHDARPRRRLSEEGAGVWTDKEHGRFLEAMELYPKGPWKLVSEYVGTRNARQTMTHAQKYRQKLERHQRGLRTKRKDAALFDSAAGIRPARLDKILENSPVPLEYGSPKDVSADGWMGPMESLLHQNGGVANEWWHVQDATSMLPLADMDPRFATPVELQQPVFFDECLDYFIESLS